MRSKRDSRSEKAGKQPPRRNRIRPPLANVLPKLQAIERLVPLAMICLDAQGRVTSWNKAAEQLLGWSEAETLGRELPYVPVGSEQESDALWRRVMQGEESLGTEIRRVRKDGRPVYLQLWTTIIKDEAGAFVGTLGLLADITHRKQAEATKSIGEQRWQTLIDAEPECVKVTSADGMLLDMNPAGLAMIEADSLEQVRGRSILPIVAPEHREVFAAFTQRAANGQPGRLQFQIVGLKGTRRWMETHAVPFVNERGEQATVLAITHDITERKRAEEALRESERALNTLVSNLPGIVYRCKNDPDWTLDYISEQVRTLLGYLPHEFYSKGITWAQHMHPGDRERIWNEVQSALSRREPFSFEYRMHTRDGRKIWVWEQGQGVYAPDGTLVSLEGFVTDITERKRAEEALRESETRYQLANRATFNAIWDWDLQSDAVWWNERLQSLFGYRTEEVESGSESWTNRIHPEDVSRVMTGIHAAIDSGQDTWFDRYRFRRKDGQYAEVEDRGYISRDASGTPRRMIGAMQDITERHRAEEALRESEGRFRSAFENTAVGMVLLDINGRFLRANQAFCTLVGYAEDELRSKTFLEITHPEDLEKNLPTVRQLMAGEIESFFVEKRYLHKLGHPVWVHASVASVRDAMGKPLNFIAQSQDITARKQAEEVLRISEEQFRVNFDLAAVGQAQLNVAGRFIRVNTRFCELTGYSEAELLTMSPLDLDHPDDRERDATDIAAVMRGETDNYLIEKRYVRRDGHTIWVNVSARLIRDPVGRPLRSIAVIQDITARKQAEDRLRKSEEQYRRLVDTMQEGLGVQDQHGLITFVNQRLCEMVGYAREELIGQPAAMLFDAENQKILREQMERRRKGERLSFEVAWRRKDGGKIDTIISPNPRFDANGNFVESTAVVTDITERKRLEEALRQTQKMEAVGRLAGGIAHDFNNLLTVIGGCSDLVQHRIDPQDPLSRYIQDIKTSSDRAAALTRQLLAYSRRQVMETKVLSLNDSILAMEPMLRRLIGEHIELALVLCQDLGAVKADPGQIEQVIMNLALNARDSMPNGGRLTIATVNAAFDQGNAGKPPNVHVPSGAYAQLIVTDTGLGMDKSTLAHLFEPFFTTKDVGKGTGLGLATVHGIVAQSGGVVWACSEPGEGASFTVCLPHVAQAPEPPIPSAATPRLTRGSETILLTEDEESVRALTREVLEGQGYRVLEARNGVEALALASQHAGPIHLLLTDLVMPEMDGHVLARRLTSDRRELKVLYMSGYTEDTNLQRGIFDVRAAFIPKPMRIETLLKKVRDVLEASS